MILAWATFWSAAALDADVTSLFEYGYPLVFRVGSKSLRFS